MTRDDTAARTVTTGIVLAVGLFAAAVSYSHLFDLAREYGQPVTDARILPLSVDGPIISASLVQLRQARAGLGTPALARWILWISVSATVTANVMYGLGHGPVGAIISAWPALAFIGSTEMMFAVRGGRTLGAAPSAAPAPSVAAPIAPKAAAPIAPAAPAPIAPKSPAPTGKCARRPRSAPVPDDVVMREFEADLAAGNVPALREIRRRVPVGQDRAKEIRASLAAQPAPA